MHLKRVTNHLLFLTLIYLPHTDAGLIRAGATVLLPCHSLPDDSEVVYVKWINRATNKTICEWKFNKTSDSSTGQCPRFKINRTSLIIENVEFSDSGDYSCKITRLIPPPSVDSMSDVRLQVEAHPGLSLQKQNSSNDSCILLLCSLEGLNPELVNFTWIREGREGRGSLNSSTTYDMNSSLLLCKPDWSDGDTITCHANYSNTRTPLSMNITLDFSNKADQDNLTLSISCSAAAAGLILCIITIVIFCKRRKRDENGSIVFTNKVYENFSFAMARQNTQPIAKPQPEECIYEN